MHISCPNRTAAGSLTVRNARIYKLRGYLQFFSGQCPCIFWTGHELTNSLRIGILSWCFHSFVFALVSLCVAATLSTSLQDFFASLVHLQLDDAHLGGVDADIYWSTGSLKELKEKSKSTIHRTCEHLQSNIFNMQVQKCQYTCSVVRKMSVRGKLSAVFSHSVSLRDALISKIYPGWLTKTVLPLVSCQGIIWRIGSK